MPVEFARTVRLQTATRAAQRVGLSALLIILGCQSLQQAVANGDTRTIKLHHTHRDDDITVTFKRNGRYDDEGLKKLNHFLRDWRTDDATTMDPQLFDAVWEVVREFGDDKVVHIISSYRSPRTNDMLRRRSGGVARHSLHMQGKAMDFFIPGVPLENVRAAGLKLQRGGVGFYPTSGSPFVHVDVGNVRHWPRMTREQLVRVFPTGRTVHLPTDGQPLAGYALAQADLKRGGTSIAGDTETTGKTNVFARMFGMNKKQTADDEADEAAPAAQTVAARAPRPNIFGADSAPKSDPAKVETSKTEPAKAEPAPTVVAALATAARNIVPLPRLRPAGLRTTPSAAEGMQLAAVSASDKPVRAPAPQSGHMLELTPNDVISSRGYWSGRVDDPDDAPVVAQRRIETASADPDASIGPFTAPAGYGLGKPRDHLAYATPTEPAPQRAKPMGASMPRAAAIAANTTVAMKNSGNQPAQVQSGPATVLDLGDAQAKRDNSPWVRALVLAPNVERFMSTTLFGTPDFSAIADLMQKPGAMVVMTFSEDPHRGLTHQAFKGRAIEFLATATFQRRTTAALR